MTNTTAPTAQKVRVNCLDTGKLIATIDEQGVHAWCVYQKRPEVVSAAACLNAWRAIPAVWEGLSSDVLRGIMETITGVLIARDEPRM